MSFLAAIRTSSRHLLRTGQTLPSASSAFHTTVAQQGLKENDKSESRHCCSLSQKTHLARIMRLKGTILTSHPSTDREGLPEFYEAQKHEQLKDSKEGKAKWKQELASNSEAEVCKT